MAELGIFVQPRAPPCVLRLPVSRADYRSPDERAEEYFLENAAQGGAEEGGGEGDPAAAPWDKVPAAFSGPAAWPASTNLLCWSCRRGFAGPPRFVPGHFRETPAGLEVEVVGVMCSWPCAQRYVLDSLRGSWAAQDNLRLVASLVHGRPVAAVPPAPRFTEQACFGGPLDAAAFEAAVAAATARALAPPPGDPRAPPPPKAPPKAARLPLAFQSDDEEEEEEGPPRGEPKTSSVWRVCGVPLPAALGVFRSVCPAPPAFAPQREQRPAAAEKEEGAPSPPPPPPPLRPLPEGPAERGGGAPAPPRKNPPARRPKGAGAVVVPALPPFAAQREQTPARAAAPPLQGGADAELLALLGSAC